ncbi:MAG: YggT family protein [Anaerolineales bacterium]
MGFLITLIQVTANILTLIILIDVILSFFLNPFHPLRQTLDTIVEPMLAPIRQFMPQTGMLDFSPLILLILIQLIESVLVQILLSVA